MKKIIVGLVLCISALSMAAATDLIISEYVEGSGNNKALEIFNGTGAAVDLSNYTLRKQNNGAGEFVGPIVVNEILENGGTYILANAEAGSVVLALADATFLYSVNATLSFNGNDAVALYKTVNGTETMIDLVGVPNNVANWGKDMTLVRKSSIVTPSIVYSVADWDQLAIDTFTGLGSHTMDGVSAIENNNTAASDVVISAYPNPFNPTTNISFSLPQALNGSLAIYNQAGQKVSELFKGQLNKGINNFQFNAAKLNSGVYYCKLISGNQSYTQKMVLTK